MWLDARLPVRFGSLEMRAADEVVLTEAALVGAGHAAGCACCVSRSGAAVALGALFRARAVGRGAAFRGVLAVMGAEGEAAVRAALVEDAFVGGRFRLG